MKSFSFATLSHQMQEAWRNLPKPAKIALGFVFVVYLYVLPYHPILPFIRTPDSDFASVLSDQVIRFVLVGLGLNIVVGEAGLLDLGYVGFYAVGAYTTAVLSSQHASLPWLLCLPISIAVSMLAGVILGAPTLRLRGDYLAIVTLGFGEIIRITANNVGWLGGASGIQNIKHPPTLFGLKFLSGQPAHHYWLGLSFVIIILYVLSRIKRSRVGRAWTAIREDEDAAELMGVPTFQFKLWAFAIGAAVGGLAGALYAGKVGFINPDTFPLLDSILFLAAVVLGGAGNMPGVILGAIAVGYLPERLRGFSDKRVFVFGVVLVLMMVFRPGGLLPRRVGARHTVDAVAPEEAGS